MLWKRLLIATGLVAVMIVAVLIFARGDRLERQFMRSGGNFMQMLVQRPQRTGAILAVAVGVVWLGIAGGAAWQSLRRKDSGETSPTPGPSAPPADSPPADAAADPQAAATQSSATRR